MQLKSCLILILTFSIIFWSCEKGDVDTSLRITVRDSTQRGEGRISGATVKLYGNDEDMYNMRGQISTTLTSGPDGSVVFNNLDPTILYSFRIEKGCRNNLFLRLDSNHKLNTLLTEGEESSILPYIMPTTAVLKFIN